MSHSLGSFAYLSKNVFWFFEETRRTKQFPSWNISRVFLLSWQPVVKKISPFVYPVDCHPLRALALQSPFKYSFVFRCFVFFKNWRDSKKKLCSTLFLSVEMCRYFTPCLFENWREKVAGRQCWGENRHWKWFFKKGANLPWLSRYRSESWEQQNQQKQQ